MGYKIKHEGEKRRAVKESEPGGSRNGNTSIDDMNV